MTLALKSLWTRFSLAEKFVLASAAVLLAGMLALGWWTTRAIEEAATRTNGTVAALYIKSFIAPQVQELAKQEQLSPESIATIKRLIEETPIGGRIVSIKVWSPKGLVVYSNQASLIGKIYPLDESLSASLEGRTTAELSALDDDENVIESQLGQPLLEIYSPVRDEATGKIIGAVEFYERATDLTNELQDARWNTWRNVAIGSAVIFALLFGIVREGSKTITQQRSQLETRVGQLSNILERNKKLNARVREAANRATELNEQFLRRIRTDLHDGPAQGIGFALISFEQIQKTLEAQKLNGADAQTLEKVRGSLEDALKEIRDLSGGMALPELEDVSLPQAVQRVVRAHEGRTETRVTLELGALPETGSLPLKINVYRFIQEGLTNAFRHGGGKGQKVEAGAKGQEIWVTVSDQGGGFANAAPARHGHQMGLIGMRKRVESFGGSFTLESNVNGGARVTGVFPLRDEVAADV